MADMRAVNSTSKLMEELESTDNKLHIYNADMETKLDTLAAKLDTLATKLDVLHADNLDLMDIASTDYEIVITEAVLGSIAEEIRRDIADAELLKYTRTIHVALKNSAGVLMDWFNGALPVAVTEDTTGTGSAAVADGATEIIFTNGIGSVDIEYTGAWDAGDTCTVTVGDTSTINGVSVANATSVDTVVREGLVFVLTPVSLGSSAAAVMAAIGGAGAKFTRTVNAKLTNTAGGTLTWFDGDIPIAATEATTGDGTAALNPVGANITLVAGVASIDVDYIGTWAEGDTQTVTLGDTTSVLDYAVANATSVDTLIA